MKQKVKMLKTLPGVDEGKIYPQTYQEGEQYLIGDDLLSCFVELGGVELVENGEPASRETKVTGPTETKPAAKPLGKMSKAELVAHALPLGLELVPDSMTVKEMIAAIEAHTSASA